MKFHPFWVKRSIIQNAPTLEEKRENDEVSTHELSLIKFVSYILQDNKYEAVKKRLKVHPEPTEILISYSITINALLTAVWDKHGKEI